MAERTSVLAARPEPDDSRRGDGIEVDDLQVIDDEQVRRRGRGLVQPLVLYGLSGLGGGLALVAVSLWLMTGLTPTSSWTALLPGFIIGGLGIGVVNPALATSAISTVRREQAGVGSGINATFRQVGIATGIAALGAIFQHQVAAYAWGHPQLGAALPEASFVSGLNDILWVGFGIAAVGSVLAFVLVRGKDFIASAPEAASAH